MSARRKPAGRRAGKLKAVFWFNGVLLAVMGGWFVMQPAPRRAEVTKLVENYFEKNKRIELPNGTAVPEAFFMVVIDESDGRVRAQALVFPQEALAAAELGRFVVSVDEVEKRTGLDFMHELEDGAEDALEAKRVEGVW